MAGETLRLLGDLLCHSAPANPGGNVRHAVSSVALGIRRDSDIKDRWPLKLSESMGVGRTGPAGINGVPRKKADI